MTTSPSAPLATLDPGRLIRHTDQLLDRCTWPRQQLLAFQRKELDAILRHAVGASSYYRDTIGPFVARNAPYEEFPILTKQRLMQNFDRIVTDRRVTRHLVEQHLAGSDPGALLLKKFRVAATGGTTGEKGLAVFDDEAWLAAIANTLRFQKILGIDETTKNMSIFASAPVHISFRIGAEMRALRPPGPRLNVLMPIEDVVDGLNSYQPEIVSTYPSFVRTLASEQSAGRLRIRPRLIRTSAETLTRDIRDIADAAWGAVVANSYTCTEAGAMGHECDLADGLHLAEDTFLFEVVDANNRAVPNGAAGVKLLVTSLTNRVLPLIRYEISDIVTLAAEPCRCGLPFWRIASIDGRREEVLQFAARGGGTVDVHAHRLRSPLTSIEGVGQFQFAQLPDGIEIKIVLSPGFHADEVSEKIELATQKALAAVDAQPARISVRVIDSISRSGAGAKEKLVAAPVSHHVDAGRE